MGRFFYDIVYEHVIIITTSLRIGYTNLSSIQHKSFEYGLSIQILTLTFTDEFLTYNKYP